MEKYIEKAWLYAMPNFHFPVVDLFIPYRNYDNRKWILFVYKLYQSITLLAYFFTVRIT